MFDGRGRPTAQLRSLVLGIAGYIAVSSFPFLWEREGWKGRGRLVGGRGLGCATGEERRMIRWGFSYLASLG